MDMEGVRSSTIAALLFLTLVLAAASGGSGDDAAAAAAVEEKQCHPRADEPYMLVAFHNKDGEEIRLLADQRSELASGVSAFANRSGHWFYAGIRAEGKSRCRLLPLPQPNNNRSRGGSRTAEGFWNTLGVLAAASGDPGAADDDEEQAGYMLVGMQTGGGDKIRLVVVAFRDGERHRLLPLGSNGSSSHGSSSSHAEVVASNVLRALMNAGSSCA